MASQWPTGTPAKSRAAQIARQHLVEETGDDRLRHLFQLPDGARRHEPDLTATVRGRNAFRHQIDVATLGTHAAEHVLVRRQAVVLFASGFGTETEPRIDIAAAVEHLLELARAAHAKCGALLAQVEVLRGEFIVGGRHGVEKAADHPGRRVAAERIRNNGRGRRCRGGSGRGDLRERGARAIEGERDTGEE